MKLLMLMALAITLFATPSFAQLIDGFEDNSMRTKVAAEQVDLHFAPTPGYKGNAIKIDYNFAAGSGYAGFQTAVSPITLPENYEFSFYIKGISPNNTLEVKFLDSVGTSVWWVNKVNYSFPKEWTKVTLKKRHISKAWGPSHLAHPDKIFKIEFVVTSFNGGKGSIFLDELELRELAPISTTPETPSIFTSSVKEYAPRLFDGNKSTEWISDKSDKQPKVTLSYKNNQEFGGLIIRWGLHPPKSFKVEFSENNIQYEEMFSSQGTPSSVSYLPLAESESKFIRIATTPATTGLVSLAEIEIMPTSFTHKPFTLFEFMANDFREGIFPKYLNPQKSYFTVTGVNFDRKESMINEEGMVESDKGKFSLEPFIVSNKELLTWKESSNKQELVDGYMPIPKVIRTYANGLELTTTTFASGDALSSNSNVIYTIKNNGSSVSKGSLYVAIRPFQVNPSYQFLNMVGGVAPISSIKVNKNYIQVDEKRVYPTVAPNSTSLNSFIEGDAIALLDNGLRNNRTTITDPHHYASGVLEYPYSLAPGEQIDYSFVMPFYEATFKQKYTPADVKTAYNETYKYWEATLNKVEFIVPKQLNQLKNTVRSNIAYILINKDSVGTQPGSRSYERSWIRDGSLTSSALLKMGISDDVKKYIDWYYSYQYPSGKVPCVVDHRGPDPVPEHDSPGQFIFLLKQYLLFTGDTAFVKEQFQHIVKAVEYLRYLIAQRSTDEYKNKPELQAFYGILPESISHEGYSEKPMHSYWDNFFAIKGLKDAVSLADAIGEKQLASEWKVVRDEFQKNLYRSIDLATKAKNINYIPGCVELGDFDATSTTIALYPCNERANLPAELLDNTFERYWKFFVGRRDTSKTWVNYTPYELRVVGAYIYLDQPERAHALLDFFFKDQRPQGWNHWAEVVWREYDAPRFIGDMPHTWVGSDFISAARAHFVYEDESNDALVVGAGITTDWLNYGEPIGVKNVKTYYGAISYLIKPTSSGYTLSIEKLERMPKGGIRIYNMFGLKPGEKILVNGNSVTVENPNAIFINELPATLEIKTK